MRQPSKVERADLAVAKATAPLRRTLVVRLLGAGSELADQPQLISACVLTALIGLASRNMRLAKAGARMLAAELVATKIKSLLKHRIDRTRPRVVNGGKRYRLSPGHDHDSGYNSFPSGHTAGAVAVARAFARDYPEYDFAAYSFSAAVAAIQVPRSQHYPTDLAAGAIVGLAAEATIHAGERAAVAAWPAVRSILSQPTKSGLDNDCFTPVVLPS